MTPPSRALQRLLRPLRRPLERILGLPSTAELREFLGGHRRIGEEPVVHWPRIIAGCALMAGRLGPGHRHVLAMRLAELCDAVVHHEPSAGELEALQSAARRVRRLALVPSADTLEKHERAMAVSTVRRMAQALAVVGPTLPRADQLRTLAEPYLSGAAEASAIRPDQVGDVCRGLALLMRVTPDRTPHDSARVVLECLDRIVQTRLRGSQLSSDLIEAAWDSHRLLNAVAELVDPSSGGVHASLTWRLADWTVMRDTFPGDAECLRRVETARALLVDGRTLADLSRTGLASDLESAACGLALLMVTEPALVTPYEVRRQLLQAMRAVAEGPLPATRFRAISRGREAWTVSVRLLPRALRRNLDFSDGTQRLHLILKGFERLASAEPDPRGFAAPYIEGTRRVADLAPRHWRTVVAGAALQDFVVEAPDDVMGRDAEGDEVPHGLVRLTRIVEEMAGAAWASGRPTRAQVDALTGAAHFERDYRRLVGATFDDPIGRVANAVHMLQPRRLHGARARATALPFLRGERRIAAARPGEVELIMTGAALWAGHIPTGTEGVINPLRCADVIVEAMERVWSSGSPARRWPQRAELAERLLRYQIPIMDPSVRQEAIQASEQIHLARRRLEGGNGGPEAGGGRLGPGHPPGPPFWPQGPDGGDDDRGPGDGDGHPRHPAPAGGGGRTHASMDPAPRPALVPPTWHPQAHRRPPQRERPRSPAPVGSEQVRAWRR